MSSPYTSSPTGARAIAKRIAADGFVTVSDRRSIGGGEGGEDVEDEKGEERDGVEGERARCIRGTGAAADGRKGSPRRRRQDRRMGT